MTTLSCKVTSVETITDTVYRVRLLPSAPFSFRAGQYLMVVMDERDKRPFSIASTPMDTDFIELHIGASDMNLYAMAVMDRILKEDTLLLCSLDPADRAGPSAAAPGLYLLGRPGTSTPL